MRAKFHLCETKEVNTRRQRTNKLLGHVLDCCWEPKNIWIFVVFFWIPRSFWSRQRPVKYNDLLWLACTGVHRKTGPPVGHGRGRSCWQRSGPWLDRTVHRFWHTNSKSCKYSNNSWSVGQVTQCCAGNFKSCGVCTVPPSRWAEWNFTHQDQSSITLYSSAQLLVGASPMILLHVFNPNLVKIFWNLEL